MSGSAQPETAAGPDGPAPPRPRARDLGIHLGLLPPGPLNAITDVAGVRVGHATLLWGEGPLAPGQGPVRTGVTAILPHEGNLFQEKVPAAAYVFNGFGKATGLHQVNELGNLESPILLTNTLNVPLVADAALEWLLERNPDIGVRTGTVNPVVAEISDGHLNDLQGRHVRREHVFQALNSARPGPVEEGSVGGGTGATCMGFKGGIGTASRALPPVLGGYTVGVLVQTNFFEGALTVNGAPVGREMGRYPFKRDLPYQWPDPGASGDSNPTPGVQHPTADPERPGPGEAGGSVVVVVATDAPLEQRQLRRVAKRAVVGLARTGFFGGNGSGDFFLAFSTAHRIPHRGERTREASVVGDESMNPLFLAAAEATEEAVVNSLLRATSVVGRDDHTVEAIDVEELLRVLARYNAASRG